MNEKSVLNEIRNLKQEFANAKKIPFSRFVSVDRNDIISRLESIERILPDEMKKAFFIDKKREEILQKAYKESEEIIARAESERKKLVSDSNIVKEAKLEKEQIINAAREEANSIIKEGEQYTASLLNKVENVLTKAGEAIKQGKENLLYENSDSEDKEQ